MIFILCQIPPEINAALYSEMLARVVAVQDYPDARVSELIDGYGYLDEECFVPHLSKDHNDWEDLLALAVEEGRTDEVTRLRGTIQGDIAYAKRAAIQKAGLQLLEKFILPLVPRMGPDESLPNLPEETEIRTPYPNAEWDLLITGGHSDGGPPTEDSLGLEFLDALHVCRVNIHEIRADQIVSKWEAEYVAPNDGDLDDEVHSIASTVGTDKNNGGPREQVLYLLQNGVEESHLDSLVGYKDRSEPEPKTFFLNERQEPPVIPAPEPCEACDDTGWLDADNDGNREVQRCDSCQKYDGDESATEAAEAMGFVVSPDGKVS